LFHSSVFGEKTRAASCISQRAVAFQSGPDAKNMPALKGSSANQISSFSLMKNKFNYFSYIYTHLTARFLLCLEIKKYRKRFNLGSLPLIHA
jgi:hypothetical protein